MGPAAPDVFTLSIKENSIKPIATTSTDAAGAVFYETAEYLTAGDAAAGQVARVNSSPKVRATLHRPDEGQWLLM